MKIMTSVIWHPVGAERQNHSILDVAKRRFI